MRIVLAGVGTVARNALIGQEKACLGNWRCPPLRCWTSIRPAGKDRVVPVLAAELFDHGLAELAFDDLAEIVASGGLRDGLSGASHHEPR